MKLMFNKSLRAHRTPQRGSGEKWPKRIPLGLVFLCADGCDIVQQNVTLPFVFLLLLCTKRIY